MKDLEFESGVMVTTVDQCMYGLKTKGQNSKEEMHAKKPTTFMTNSRALRQELSRTCDGKHIHQNLVDGRAHRAARYPPGL